MLLQDVIPLCSYQRRMTHLLIIVLCCFVTVCLITQIDVKVYTMTRLLSQFGKIKTKLETMQWHTKRKASLHFTTNIISVSHPNSDHVTEYLRRLRHQGMEPTADHEFKSPYIVDPVLYHPDVFHEVPGNRSTKIISCYNCPEYFHMGTFENCSYTQCRFDRFGKRESKADVLLFYPAPVKMPTRPKGQIWAYCTWESPVHYQFPKPYSAWKDVFNWTFDYRRNSDVFRPYHYMVWRAKEDLLSDSEYQRAAQAKTKSVAWLVTNCDTPSRRLDYVNIMKDYIDIDIHGNCGSGRWEKPLSEYQEMLNDTYYFYLSFENSFCEDYVTEKFFNNFDGRVNVLPVVRGAFEYDTYFPPNTFIDAAKFRGPKELALYLKSLANDIPRYSQMLKEKDKLLKFDSQYRWCDLCQALHQGVKHKMIKDIKMYSSQNTCWDSDKIRLDKLS